MRSLDSQNMMELEWLCLGYLLSLQARETLGKYWYGLKGACPTGAEHT